MLLVLSQINGSLSQLPLIVGRNGALDVLVRLVENAIRVHIRAKIVLVSMALLEVDLLVSKAPLLALIEQRRVCCVVEALIFLFLELV